MMDKVQVINNKFAAVWTTIVVIFVLTPLASIVFVSLSAAKYISFPWNEGFSLQWYAEIPKQTTFLVGAWDSLQLAVFTALIAVIIGTTASLAIVRYTFPGKSVISLLGSSSLFVPEVLLGLAILLVMASWHIGDSLTQLLAGHVVITIPFVLRVTTAALTGFNPDQEFAAQNLGAGKFRAFFLVTFPQIRSGIIASAIMAFIVSFDNVALSLFLAGPGFRLLPVELYAYAQNNFDGVAAAVSVAMIAVSLILIVVLEKTVGLDKLFGGDPSSKN